MSKVKRYIGLGVVAAGAAALAAQPPTNGLWGYDGVATDRLMARRTIATNTTAFEEYGLRVMLAQANQVREQWNLDIPEPLTVSNVNFNLWAYVGGVTGDLTTKDGRFVWQFWINDFYHFADTNYYPHSFRHHDEQSARLTRIKSNITSKEAAAIARDALHRLGLSEKQLKLIEPPSVNQYKFEESDGTIYPLPMFNVGWKIKEFLSHSPPSGQNAVVFDVSGITRRVAEYANTHPRRPRIPLPTNYFQMLNLPTNYLQTLSRRERIRIGLAPLTNSPSQTTNATK